MSQQRSERAVAKLAEEFGFAPAGRTSRGHLKWRNPHGFMVITVKSLGDVRSEQNIRCDFRRHQNSKPRGVNA